MCSRKSSIDVAWTHGCLGIRFWFRLQPWFARVRGSLLCDAVLLPVLALLGLLQSGRDAVALARDPGWRAVALALDRTGATAQIFGWLTYATTSLCSTVGPSFWYSWSV